MNFLWIGPHARKWKTVSRTRGQSSYQKPVRSWALSHKKMHSANNLNELRRVFFTNQASRWECSPVDILITVLWDPGQKTLLNHAQNPDPQNSEITCVVLSYWIWDNFLPSNRKCIQECSLRSLVSLENCLLETTATTTKQKKQASKKFTWVWGSHIFWFISKWVFCTFSHFLPNSSLEEQVIRRDGEMLYLS